MRGIAVPDYAGGNGGAAQHGLAQGHAAQGGGVEYRKWMEGAAFDAGALDGGIEKTEVEMCVVSNQDGALAICRFHARAHGRKQAREYIAFRQGGAQRVKRVDAIDFQRSLLDVGTGKR